MKHTGTKSRAREAVARQRHIQRETDQRDATRTPSPPKKKAVQAGPRREPANPLPAQHLTKPGRESDLDPAPRFEAPDYRGSGKLEGKRRAHHRRRLGHRSRGRGAVRARRRGRRDRLSRRTRRRREDRGHVRRRRPRMPADRRRRSRCGVLSARGRADRAQNSASSTCSSTTRRSRSTRESIEDLTDEQFDLTMRTNVYGYFHMARRRCRICRAAARSSTRARRPASFGSAQLLDYSATKGAIHAFTKSLAANLLPQRHPRERGRAGAGVDAAESGRPVRRRTSRNSASRERHAPARATRRDLAGVRVPRGAVRARATSRGIILPVMGGPTG